MSVNVLDDICLDKTIVNDISIIKVNLVHATYKYAGDFKNCLEETIKLGNYKLILDFSQCQFVDSTFLGSIAVLIKALRSVSGSIKIVCASSVLKSIFESNGIHRVIELYPDLETALESFNI